VVLAVMVVGWVRDEWSCQHRMVRRGSVKAAGVAVLGRLVTAEVMVVG
jgi:hypothetical protein